MEYVTRFNAGQIEDLRKWIQNSEECECQIRERKLKRMDRIMGESRLSPKFRKRTFERFMFIDPQDWEDPKDQEAAAKLLRSQRMAHNMVLEYTNNWSQQAMDGRGVGLFGDPGTAKTHLLAAKTIRLIDQGIQSVFVNTADIFQEIRNCFEVDGDGKTVRQNKPSEIIDLMKSCDDLSLDDLGTERPSTYVLEILYTILNHRYEYELPTSFTTNLSDEELKAHLTPKTYRRLIEPCAGMMATIRGPSFERLLMKIPLERRGKYC